MGKKLEALNRVRANYTSFNDDEFLTGTYRTQDIKEVLTIIDELESKVNSIKSDLEDLLGIIQSKDSDCKMVMDLIESTLKAME